MGNAGLTPGGVDRGSKFLSNLPCQRCGNRWNQYTVGTQAPISLGRVWNWSWWDYLPFHWFQCCSCQEPRSSLMGAFLFAADCTV